MIVEISESFFGFFICIEMCAAVIWVGLIFLSPPVKLTYKFRFDPISLYFVEKAYDISEKIVVRSSSITSSSCYFL